MYVDISVYYIYVYNCVNIITCSWGGLLCSWQMLCKTRNILYNFIVCACTVRAAAGILYLFIYLFTGLNALVMWEKLFFSVCVRMHRESCTIYFNFLSFYCICICMIMNITTLLLFLWMLAGMLQLCDVCINGITLLVLLLLWTLAGMLQ